MISLWNQKFDLVALWLLHKHFYSLAPELIAYNTFVSDPPSSPFYRVFPADIPWVLSQLLPISINVICNSTSFCPRDLSVFFPTTMKRILIFQWQAYSTFYTTWVLPIQPQRTAAAADALNRLLQAPTMVFLSQFNRHCDLSHQAKDGEQVFSSLSRRVTSPSQKPTVLKFGSFMTAEKKLYSLWTGLL